MQHQQSSAGDGNASVSAMQTSFQALPTPEGFPVSVHDLRRWLAGRSIRGYVNGCEHGEAAALLYLRRVQAGTVPVFGSLQSFALDWESRLQAARSQLDEEAAAGLQGHAVGFFTTLE
jgi:hypothetical protein